MDNKAILDEIQKHAILLEYHIKRLKKKPESLHDIDIDLMSEKVKEIYILTNNLLPDDGGAVNPEVEVRNAERDEDREPGIEKQGPKIGERASSEEPEAVSERHEPQPLPREPQPATSDPHPAFQESQSGSRDPRTATPEPGEEDRVTETTDQGTKTGEEKTTSEPEKTFENRNPQPETPAPRPSSPAPPNPQSESGDPQPAPREPDSRPAKTTADLFSGPTTIADSFQNGKDNSIAARVNPNPVTDLRNAIGINDKFLFINELFKGDPAIYNQAVESLNAAGNHHAASSLLEGYRSEYSWGDRSEAYHRLKKIVNSKYDG